MSPQRGKPEIFHLRGNLFQNPDLSGLFRRVQVSQKLSRGAVKQRPGEMPFRLCGKNIALSPGDNSGLSRQNTDPEPDNRKFRPVLRRWRLNSNHHPGAFAPNKTLFPTSCTNLVIYEIKGFSAFPAFQYQYRHYGAEPGF